MKRRVATNWKEKRFSRDGRGTTRWSLYFPQMEKGKRREAKRRRERWRSMWEMYVWTRKRGEINSRGLHGIGRIGVYFTENIPCNCNDDLYRDKRIDFLPRISPCPRRPKKGLHYTIYTSIIQGSVCALFSSRQFFTEIENPLKDSGGRIYRCSISALYIFIEEWIRRIERESMTWKWMMEILSVEASRVHHRYFSQHRDPGRWLISYIFDSNTSWISSSYFTFHAYLLWIARSRYTNFHRSRNLL